MNAVRVLLGVAFAALCLGCGLRPVQPLPDEEEENAVPAPPQPPQSKPMARAHKEHGPEYQGKPLDHWVAESKSQSAASRRAAAVALGNLGPAAAPALTPLLSDSDLGVKLAAAEALKKIREGK